MTTQKKGKEQLSERERESWLTFMMDFVAS